MGADELVPILEERDIVTARHIARQTAIAMAFSGMDQSRITTAVSELARNVVRYGVRGTVTLRRLTDAHGTVGLEVTVEDEGPGITNIEEALRPGFTTSGGLGLGLSGTRRLMDEMTIENRPEGGARITVRKWRR